MPAYGARGRTAGTGTRPAPAAHCGGSRRLPAVDRLMHLLDLAALRLLGGPIKEWHTTGYPRLRAWATKVTTMEPALFSYDYGERTCSAPACSPRPAGSPGPEHRGRSSAR